MMKYGFMQYVKEPTRDSNFLDLVFTNNPFSVTNCINVPPIGTSDHAGVNFKLFLPDDSKLDECGFRFVPDFINADYGSINYHLSNICWESILCGDDVNTCWNKLTDILADLINTYVPVKRVCLGNKRDPFYKRYPLYIRQLLRKKNAAWRLYKGNKLSVGLQMRYNAIKEKCTKAIENYIKNNEESLINRGNLGRF